MLGIGRTLQKFLMITVIENDSLWYARATN